MMEKKLDTSTVENMETTPVDLTTTHAYLITISTTKCSIDELMALVSTLREPCLKSGVTVSLQLETLPSSQPPTSQDT